MVKFVIGTRGLNTSIDEFFTEDQWNTLAYDAPPNTSWDTVEVETEEDVASYVLAMNRYLNAAWTPNQDYEDREENGVIMAEAQAEMQRLRKN